MREYPDHGTSTSGRTRRSSRPSLTASRQRLYAKRRAPMWRRTSSASTGLSSTVNRKAAMRAMGRHPCRRVYQALARDRGVLEVATEGGLSAGPLVEEDDRGEIMVGQEGHHPEPPGP